MTNLQKYTATKILKNLQDTKQFAKEFLEFVQKFRSLSTDKEDKTSEKDDKIGRNVILLQGELGAGKTTFSQFLLRELGARGPFTSPTFVIMKKYEIDDGRRDLVDSKKETDFHFKNIYHLDCYRVDEESVLDLSWEEIIADQNNLILVEWPERIKKIWPKKYWLLKFKYNKDVKNGRIVEVNVV